MYMKCDKRVDCKSSHFKIRKFVTMHGDEC